MRHSGESLAPHRVLPDGCGDIIFTAGSGKPTLQVIGAMTRFQDVQMSPGQLVVGMRFHPGRWASPLGVPGDLITDQQPALEEFWGRRARTLLARMEDARTAEECVSGWRRASRVSRLLLPSSVRWHGCGRNMAWLHWMKLPGRRASAHVSCGAYVASKPDCLLSCWHAFCVSATPCRVSVASEATTPAWRPTADTSTSPTSSLIFNTSPAAARRHSIGIPQLNSCP